jgi:uncharacterized protein YggE
VLDVDSSVKVASIVSISFVLVIVVGLVVLSSIFSGNDDSTLTAEGTSEMTVSPDRVSIYFNIETVGENFKEAKDKNDLIVDAFLVALIKEGFNREALQTVGLNVYEDFDWISGRRKPIGFKAVHAIKIVLDSSKMDKAGEIIDAGIDSNASLSYINFELSEERKNEYQAKAMENAARDARVKAESMATGLNKKLGKLLSVTESSFDYQPWRYYDAVDGVSAEENRESAKLAAVNIQPSEKTINARVSAVFEIR